MEEIKNNRMAEMPVKRLMLSMGIPMIISMVLQAVYNIVDSAFVSNMAENGENALNALTLAFPLQILQVEYITQLSGILESTNQKVIIKDESIFISKNHSSKKVIVYPAMKKAPIDDDTIYVSDAYIKFAKPYALRKLTLK